MEKFKSYREHSKTNYGNKKEGATLEEINTGSLQRIADAAELMATNFLKLQSDLEYYKNKAKSLEDELKTERKRVATYKGQATRIKKKNLFPPLENA